MVSSKRNSSSCWTNGRHADLMTGSITLCACLAIDMEKGKDEMICELKIIFLSSLFDRKIPGTALVCGQQQVTRRSDSQGVILCDTKVCPQLNHGIRRHMRRSCTCNDKKQSQSYKIHSSTCKVSAAAFLYRLFPTSTWGQTFVSLST